MLTHRSGGSRESKRERLECHGRRSRGGQGGQVPPRIWSGGTLMQIVPPPRFCHIGTKMSVLWLSKYAKIRFRPGLCPGPRWGAHDAPPDPLVGWRGDTPPHTRSHSARTHLRRSPCVPPEVQPDLRLCRMCNVRHDHREREFARRSSTPPQRCLHCGTHVHTTNVRC